MDIDSDVGWTNAAVAGVRKRLQNWGDIETSDGHYDFTVIDGWIATAASKGKRMGLSVVCLGMETGSTRKTWPADLEPTATYNLPSTASDHSRTIILGWDPKVQPRLLAFFKALCLHVDGKVDYIAMGGLGAVVESYICDDPATIGLSETDAIAAWTGSADAIIEVHAANLKQTPFIFTMGRPFNGQASNTAMDTLLRAKAAKYPHRFGVMDCGLGDTSNVGYLPNELVSDLSATNPTGLQCVTSTQGFGNHPPIHLQTTLDAAVTLKAHWVEVYPVDANDPANAQLLTDYTLKLAK